MSEDIVMNLIVNGGDARSLSLKAIRAAKEGDITQAEQLLEEAKTKLGQAHLAQTNLITMEANQQQTQMSLLLIHAQDHLMSAITVRDIAIEIVDLIKSMKHDL